jgi:putative restriction endonuclease
MDFWVGVTDNDWYNFLKELQPDEVNFWQPSGTPPFKRKVELFLFKLHSPLNFVVGGGYFVTYTNLPISIAWETFKEKNGVPTYVELTKTILDYRESHGKTHGIDPEIGCSILTEPFFFEKDLWIPIPEDWKPNIVRGKIYTTTSSSGSNLFQAVQDRLTGVQLNLEISKDVETNTSPNTTRRSVIDSGARYGAEYKARARLGQGAFRVIVTDAYNRRCAMTGERTLPVLDAAHIKDYAESGPHSTSNGLLLRADLHRLFDRHYITITSELNIEVSQRIKEEFQNGAEYYKLHGKRLVNLPGKHEDHPNKEYIEWHNNLFLG